MVNRQKTRNNNPLGPVLALFQPQEEEKGQDTSKEDNYVIGNINRSEVINAQSISKLHVNYSEELKREYKSIS